MRTSRLLLLCFTCCFALLYSSVGARADEISELFNQLIAKRTSLDTNINRSNATLTNQGNTLTSTLTTATLYQANVTYGVTPIVLYRTLFQKGKPWYAEKEECKEKPSMTQPEQELCKKQSSAYKAGETNDPYSSLFNFLNQLSFVAKVGYGNGRTSLFDVAQQQIKTQEQINWSIGVKYEVCLDTLFKNNYRNKKCDPND